MNIRKVLGISLLFSLTTCDTFSKGITCQHAQDPLLKLFVHDSAAPEPPLDQQFAQPQVRQVAPSTPYNRHSQEEHSHSAAAQLPQKPVASETNHVHTEENAPGAKSNRKTLWQQNSRNHQTSQSYDKNGSIHQVHKWRDAKGRKHETDQWEDEGENVHQCHRYQDDDGCVHQSIQVTDLDGRVTNEHFKKDINGRITKVQSGEVEESARQPALSHQIITEAGQGEPKGILHAPNCPNLRKTS